MRQTSEGKATWAWTTSAPSELIKLGTNGIQQPDQAGRATSSWAPSGSTPTSSPPRTAGPASSPPTSPGPRATRWASLPPEAIKPNKQYPFFVTTVRYQTIWQSGYTYRWQTDLARHSVPYMEFVVSPKDAKKAGLVDGDWAELRNQFPLPGPGERLRRGAARGDLGHLRLAGPHGQERVRRAARFYANNLIAGGPLQQTSNGAFFKNTRAALKKIKRPPITAENAPHFSLKPRIRPRVTPSGPLATRESRPRTSLTSRCERCCPPGAAGRSSGGGAPARRLGQGDPEPAGLGHGPSNFRCRYCMPAEGLDWLPRQDVLGVRRRSPGWCGSWRRWASRRSGSPAASRSCAATCPSWSGLPGPPHRGVPRPVPDYQRRPAGPPRRPAGRGGPAPDQHLARLPVPHPLRGDHPPGCPR